MQTIMIRTIGMILLIFFVVPSLIAQQIDSISEDIDEVLAMQNQMPVIESEAYAFLNQEIELHFTNLSIEEVLKTIAEKADLKLMYRKVLLPDDKKFTYENSSMTVYEVLWEVLEGTGLQFAISNSGQLILLKKKIPEILEHEIFQPTIRGQVVDAQSGESIPGVNVAVEGTNIGTITDVDGEYELTLPYDDVEIVFSFVGYQTKRITYANQEVIDVSLQQEIGRLDEVIVIGYGTVERRDLTGSVESVRAETFQSQGMTQLGDMLTEGYDVWDFDDGSVPVAVKSNIDTGTHAKVGYATVTHRFENPGDYLVKVQRETSDGTATAHLYVEVIAP